MKKKPHDNNDSKNQVIKSHDFDEAKKQLENFSKNIHESVELQTVATSGGLFGWFDHKVTGDELNNLTSKIQEYLISINNQEIKTVKEFHQIYKAFEALDKDYIQGILIAIKAAEEASNQAKEMAYEVQKNCNVINKTIEALKRTTKELIKIKKQIEKYEHLENIDEIWIDTQTIKNDKINHDEKLNKLFKQVKIAYIIAGSSIIIAITIFILNILGII